MLNAPGIGRKKIQMCWNHAHIYSWREQRQTERRTRKRREIMTSWYHLGDIISSRCLWSRCAKNRENERHQQRTKMNETEEREQRDDERLGLVPVTVVMLGCHCLFSPSSFPLSLIVLINHGMRHFFPILIAIKITEPTMLIDSSRSRHELCGRGAPNMCFSISVVFSTSSFTWLEFAKLPVCFSVRLCALLVILVYVYW